MAFGNVSFASNRDLVIVSFKVPVAMANGTLGRRARLMRALSACLALVCVLFCAIPSRAQGRVSFLANRLQSEDARVRTQAALALGGTNDEAAVPPLCEALSDESELVRQASAAALAKLKRESAGDCLKERDAVERSAKVKSQIARALAAIVPAEPAVRTNTKARFYVALSPVANKTGRSQSEVERIVAGAVRTKLDALGEYQIAPAKETVAAANAAIKKRDLKGYYLAIAVDKFDYSGGNLRVRVKIAVFTYPTRNLRGEVPASLTQMGVREGDSDAEDNLLDMAAARAAELFAKNFK